MENFDNGLFYGIKNWVTPWTTSLQTAILNRDCVLCSIEAK